MTDSPSNSARNRDYCMAFFVFLQEAGNCSGSASYTADYERSFVRNVDHTVDGLH